MEEMMVQQETPWARRVEVGFLNAILTTIKEILLEPRKYFEKYKISAGVGTPYTFFILIAFITTAISWIFGSIFTLITAGEAAVFPLIFYLIFVSLAVFIQSGLIHLFVKFFKGEGGYKETFHACAYGFGAAAVFNIIPFLGGLIGTVWGAVAVICGLMQSHKLDGLKASMAFFLPGLIFMLLFALAMLQPFIRGTCRF